MIGIPLGLAVGNLFEWGFHKYVLHGLGKNRKSFWSFHWHDHHRSARTHEMIDEEYSRSIFRWSPKSKEALALLGGALSVTPLFPVAPFFVGTLWWTSLRYYRVHKRAHQDLAWAKEHLPWHYDHHMGKDQNANWCVSHPFFDHVLGTRKKSFPELGKLKFFSYAT